MPAQPLSAEEKQLLLVIARQAMEGAVMNHFAPPVQHKGLTQALMDEGASFVTLTISGELRGCIGALEAYQPLVDDVHEHAIAAALEDYRFPPVQAYELPHIAIEVSLLTPPVAKPYQNATDLLTLLRPGVDGVILKDGRHRATFLPQVWEKVPKTDDFLTHLCLKMGAAGDLWRRKKLQVLTYQVEEFREN